MRVLLGEPNGADPWSVYDSPRTAARCPWVLANMVCGLDGATSVGGRVRTLSGPADQRLFAHLRSLVDVVLVGAGTVRAERYGHVTLTAEQRAARRSRDQDQVPRLAVVSRSLALDPDLPLFANPGPRPLVVTAGPNATAAAEHLADRAEVMVAGDDEVDLPAVLDRFAGEGVSVVLTEGGPRLLSALIECDLLDELCLTLAPFVGGDPVPVAQTVLPSLRRFRLESVLADDGFLFLRYLTGHR